MRIAICTNFVSPYRRPLFEALAAETGASVRVFVSTEMERDRDWTPTDSASSAIEIARSFTVTRRRTHVTRGAQGFTQALERHFPIGLPVDLVRYRPDVIISGELGPRTMLAMAAGRVLGVPVIPWTYHPDAQAQHADGSALKRRLVTQAPAVIGMGSQARRVLRGMGCPDTSIFDALNAADTATIASRLGTAAHRDRVAQIRRDAGGKRTALVVGRLVPMKGIEPLLGAWRAVPALVRKSWRVVFLGTGPLRSHVERSRDIGAVSGGHVHPRELADWYAASDLHVFASMGDPWGLVVNEAMQCGTPTLCSRLAGCSDDLIDHGRNGLIFDPSVRTGLLARAVTEALSRTDLDALGAAAQRDAQLLTPTAMARGMAAAVGAALATHPGRRHSA